MTVPPAVLRIVLIVLGAYVALIAVACVVQRKMLYFPDDSVVVPEDGMQDVSLQTADDVAIKATWWPGTRDVTLILFHGNAGHRGDRFDWMRTFVNLGWNVLLVDYRGYGGSDGSPSERGLRNDADAAVAWMQANHPKQRLVYFGESIGSSVALACAARTPPAGLILQAGAIDLADVAGEHYPALPTRLILSDRFNARSTIGSIEAPLLSVHGTQDTIIPDHLGRAVFDAYQGPKAWYSVEGAGHNDLVYVGGRAYYERVHRFLESIGK